MAKLQNGFNFLGLEFQERLLKQFLEDRKFTERIVDIISPQYFTDEHLRLIAVTIKNAHEQYEAIPDVESLKMRIRSKIDNEVSLKLIMSQVDRVVSANENDATFVQETAIKFCKQQELVRSVRDIQGIIERGDLEDYDQCADLIRRALEAGDTTEDDTNVLEGLEEVLAADYRKPISTGIMGLDELMDGGLARGELGLILAPFGVGKTTMITKLANAAMADGHNVLQIFFEDNPKVIKRKHLSCWTTIPLNELSDPQWRDRLDKEIEEQGKGKGKLILKKFSSDGTTIPKIRQYIKKKISQGFRPDIILVDYIDCVQPSKEFKDVYAGEGNVMRQYETMLSDFDVAGWTAVQGNRSSIGADVVEADQMGGSIKKGQIGHFIVSIAKTLIQKEAAIATMAILKSRFGKDGIIFQDITFDNSTIQIDVTQSNSGQSFMEKNVEKASETQDKIKAIMKIASQKREEEERRKKELEENNSADDSTDNEDDTTNSEEDTTNTEEAEVV